MILVGPADTAAIGILMIVRSTVLAIPVSVPPKTPLRQSLAIMTTDPSMHVMVPVSMDTVEPRRRSVERLGLFAVKLAMVDRTDEWAEEVVRSDATGLRRPPPPEVGLGMQK
jgi:hypothetical protein